MYCETQLSDQLELRLIPHARRFNRLLAAFIAPRLKSDATLHEDVEYAVRIAAPLRERAFVVMACGHVCGVAAGLLRHVALASELMMAGALTCDDVIDGSPRRDGKQSLAKKVGPDRARLVSEVILHLAQEAIAKATISDGYRVSKVFRAFAQAGRILYAGEYLSLQGQHRPDLTPVQLDHLAYVRGGVLLEAACSAPAVLAGDATNERRFARIGRLLGSALQHRNDLIDFLSDAEITGKETFEDVLSGQPNLVLSCLFHGASANRKDFACVKRLWGQGLQNRRKSATVADVELLSHIVHTSGAIDLARRRLDAIINRAHELIEKCNSAGNMDLSLFASAIGELD